METPETPTKAETPAVTLASVIAGPPHSVEYLWTPEAIHSGVRTAGLPSGVGYEERPHAPVVTMYCERCQGARRFDSIWASVTGDAKVPDSMRDAAKALRTLVFLCRNCAQTTVCMVFRFDKTALEPSAPVRIRKVGQEPRYGQRIPARVQRFIEGEDWDLYRKARTAENLGLGIAALTYYRRVVEDLRTKLIDKLIKVAEETGETAIIPDLKAAANNWQFTQSLDDIRVAVPRRLFIRDQNPLRLLHTAFSDGVHNRSDEECLKRAVDGRMVLETLIVSIGDVLSDQQELIDAVGRLAQLGKNEKPATD